MHRFRPDSGPSGWRALLPDRLEWRGAWRALRRTPLASGTIVVALAIGIAVATAGYTFLANVLAGRLPYAEGERFVRLRSFTPAGERGEVDLERYRFLRRRATSFSYFGAIASGRSNVALPGGAVEPANAARVTAGWFAHLPARPLAGRLLGAADGLDGAPPVALVRESFWRRSLGADPRAVGRTLEVDGVAYTVVGLLPDDFRFPASGEIWLAAPERQDERASGARVAGVLAPGTSLAAAAAELDALSAAFDVDRAIAAPPRMALARFTDLAGSGLGAAMGLLLGLLILVLLLVASNVGSLVLARAVAREGELAVRSALGASRLRLARELALEVLLAGGAAAVLGFAGAVLLVHRLAGLLDADELPFWFDFTPRAGTALFVGALALLAGGFAGVLPALRATRRTVSGSRTASGAADRPSRSASFWIATEMALSVALVATAIAVARGGIVAGSHGSALPAGRLLSAQFALGEGAIAADAARLERALAAVRALPGVADAGVGTSLPTLSAATERVELEPGAGEATAPARIAPVTSASPGYLEAFAGRALAGRLLSASDFAAGAPPVAVVNEPFVQRLLGGASPLGRRLRIGSEEPPVWREIVGVVPDFDSGGGDPALAAAIYRPLERPGYLYLAARTRGDAAALAPALRRALYELDPTLPVRRVLPLELVAAEDRAALAAFAAALALVGGVSLLLSLLGIYAVISFRVARRTREIGIRVALGATPGRIARSVVGGVAGLFALGAVAGVAFAAGLLSLRASIFVARFPGPGPWLFGAVVGLLGVAAVAASWTPVRRALAVDPARALAAD